MASNLDSNVPEQFRGVFEGKSTASQQNPSLAGNDGNATSADNKTKQGDEDMENKAPELKEVVKAEVQTFFAEKDAQQKVEARITGLETEKVGLVEKVEQLTASNKVLAEEVSGLKTDKEALEAEKVTLASEKEAAEKKASEVTAKLDEIEKQRVTASRKDELEKSNILLSDETMQEKQVAKIADMSDEQFADYKAELVALAGDSAESKKKKEVKEEEEAKKGKKESAKATETSSPAVDASSNFAQALASAQNPTCDNDNVELYSQL